MDEKRYINPNNPVYISYAWANDDFPHLEDGVNALCELLEQNNIFYKRDKKNLCPYRWSISKAENEIGEGTAVIVVVSKRYVESLHCMHEWHLIRENGKIWKRVFPIVLEDAKITDKEVFMQYYEYFDKRKNDLVEQQRQRIIPLTEVESRASKFDFFVNDLQNLYQYLAEHNHYFSKDNYDTIIEQLKSLLSNNSIDIIPETPIIANTPNTAKANSVVSGTPHFTLPVADGLMPRDNEVENLCSLISKNRIANLVGVGGSGKSSLTYLFLDKHKDDFNEIAYIVVNNNVTDDVVEQLNNTLRLEFDAGEDPFSEICSYLQKNYISKKPNLLILDINETSDKQASAKTINKFIQSKNMLDGWKILILSRESMDTRHRIKSRSLNDQEDIGFLQELFLDKAGVRYRDFGDFKELFKVVSYNPLLTEQLGFYVKKYPRALTINEIKTKLYGDSFRELDMHGLAAQRHDETIVTFLKNLTKYSELTHNEKELLRHFVLWQSDYVSYDVIEDLLRGIFDSDDQLVNTLASLSDRSILTVNSGQTLSSYKLHGLLADSLRGQIDFSEEDYFRYLRNINRIIEYDYYRFLPYVDCIVNSLCEFDITTDYVLYNAVGSKLNDSWKYEYSQKVLEKNIKRLKDELKDRDSNYLRHQLVWSYIIIAGTVNNQLAKSYFEKAIAIGQKLPKENLEYQNSLAVVYNNLAILQEDHLGDYESAERNYQKAIAIREQLPKENPKYQSDLASTNNNLASLQQGYLGDYESAETNYKKAIAIGEQLPKENPDYQNGFANAYFNLAYLQQVYLGDYESAETNYRKAVAIGEQQPKENPEYQNNLASAYNNLANLQRQLGDYESAETNCKKAIAIREQLPKENQEYQNGLANAYHNLANLQQDHFEDYKSAETNYKKAIAIKEQLSKENPGYQNGLASAYNDLAIFQQDHLGDYESSERNYQKAIVIREQLPKENPEYQNDLANSYNNLAYLQQNHLGDYPSSESNYQKAIAILEQLPKENPEYQNDLAGTYNNLANLQQDHLGDYESAETNYKKAIAILEQLPKENPVYHNGLAKSYGNLANLQQDHLGDYESSETNYKKAIAILEQLPKENPVYHNGLATTYNSLAILQQNHLGDYSSSEGNYQKAIAFLEQLPKENPEYQYGLAGTYNNLANLQQDHLGDYSTSETNWKKAIAIFEQLPKENPEYQNGLAMAYNGLAYCYDAQNKYKEAVSMIETAINIAKDLSEKDSKYLINWVGFMHSLAEIVFNNNEVERAKEILDEIKPLAEKCLADNPNDSWAQTVYNDIIELLEKCAKL